MFNLKQTALKPVAKVGAWVSGTVAAVSASVVNADTAALVTSAQTAIGDAGTAAQTVGGYVVLAVAGLIVVGMIISMMRKV